MIKLPDVTLCCADTLYHYASIRALNLSMKDIEFGDVAFFTDKSLNLDHIRTVQISELADMHDYCMFVMNKLRDFIRTEYALVVHWDGYVINPEMWTDEFLNYDFIGSPLFIPSWNRMIQNGGFSLRSQKLLQFNFPDGYDDVEINRDPKRFNFAPWDLASKFGECMNLSKRSPLPFGFHGRKNLSFLGASMFEFLRPFDNIIVTGPFRSGTTICAQMIADDLNKVYVDEFEIGRDDLDALSRVVENGHNQVIQCPALCRKIETFGHLDDVAIIFMERDLAEIEKSEQRLEMLPDDNDVEFYKYVEGRDVHIGLLKYEYWLQHQMPLIKNGFIIPFVWLIDHPAFVPAKRRINFAPKQTKENS